ncbi:MAG: hypothetical protein HY077_05315 [Elusimicrobia bacterium]|nr:hypothetical protein [Elusimicrobiota bacterium]
MRNKLSALLLGSLLPALCAAQDEPGAKPMAQRYSPPSRSFYCDLPVGWRAFEELDEAGPVVHLLGPEDRSAVLRAGMDIRWNEKGETGFEPYKKALEEMRRTGGPSSRGATAVRVMRISGVLARVFEVTETRRLPEDRWPSAPVELHRYIAVYPSGESYFTISLASTRESYLEYRDLFLDFLKNFKPMGAR